MMTDFTKQAKDILEVSTKQAKDILDDSTARIVELSGEGRKVADRVLETVENTVENTRSMGKQAVEDIQAELNPADIKERINTLNIPGLFDKLNLGEFTRHSEAIKQELLTALNLPSVDALDELTVAVKKLNKEITGYKALKTEVKKLSTENKKLKETVKALKADQKEGFKTLKAQWKADLKTFKASLKKKAPARKTATKK